MKHYKSFSFGILFLTVFGLFSCVDETTNALEKQPYFDLKGFIESKIQEIDSVEVIKISQVQGEETQTQLTYAIKDWQEEFGIFTEADINKASLLESYETESSDDSLTHKLYPKSKGKVKYIKVMYSSDEISSISIKVAEKNLFYTSTTLAELYMNNESNLIDRYSIETTQKIWFLDANKMKILGELKP
ncbi:hypothetical protein J2X69_000969 [Algoriphagus sp. 4150]|uniref:hypothetical protein n=1 Tax=Algoriphagus sp. 4150 TaxID=2817756 RepID=UPI002859186C|nr:hypothetical protein [Algoriphagus sp. 4150]MDR7128637.1 hypothetical protein [Algoriphagus sp. 4150]